MKNIVAAAAGQGRETRTRRSGLQEHNVSVTESEQDVSVNESVQNVSDTASNSDFNATNQVAKSRKDSTNSGACADVEDNAISGE